MAGMQLKRRQRLATEVAPMLAKGCSAYEIAKELQISVNMAFKDAAAVKKIWAENLGEELDVVRAEGVARYENLFVEAYQAWEYSKKEGRPSDKFLTACTNILKEKHKLQGLALDVSLVQNNLAIHGEASADQVIGAFSPMNADEYQSFINEKGPLTALPPVPVTEEKEETIEIDRHNRDKSHS